jgi:polyphosphate kinase 2 (PPK2 family)
MARSGPRLSRRKLRLGKVEMRRRFGTKEEYLEREVRLQKRMLAVQQAYFHKRLRGVIVFEGWDASGKGGNIRRLTARLDPRGYKVWPIGVPSEEEQGRHYLFRFWARLPEPGTIAIFDRSWYGRVLVERIEGLIDEPSWRRAYGEINEFEDLLIADGVRVIKLFLHITGDEQLRRFVERLRDPVKRWKLTQDDLRNRARWDDYAAAYEEMFNRTSTEAAPWTLIPANRKWTARVRVLEEVVAQLGRGVKIEPPRLDPEVVEAAEQALGVSVGEVVNRS